MENRGKKKLSGWLYNHWSSCQQPKTGSHHLIAFQEIQMTRHLVLWFISRPACSVLALDHVDPALGRAGRKWDRHLLDFLHSLLCLHPGRNPPALFQSHYPICTICETKGAVGLEVPVAVIGLSNVRRTFPRLSVSLGQKEEQQQGLYSKPPKKSHWELWGGFGEKKFWKKRCVFKIILINAKKSRSLQPICN